MMASACASFFASRAFSRSRRLFSSTLNAASTLVTMDFVRRLRPAVSGRALVQIGRLTTVLVVGFGIVWAPRISQFPSLWQYIQTMLAYVTPPVAACFLFGALWKRATTAGAVAALASGLALAIALAVAPVDVHFLYIAVIVFAGSTLALVLASLATAPPPSDTAALVWTPALWRAEDVTLPWYRQHRFYTGVLLLTTAVIVGVFW